MEVGGRAKGKAKGSGDYRDNIYHNNIVRDIRRQPTPPRGRAPSAVTKVKKSRRTENSFSRSGSTCTSGIADVEAGTGRDGQNERRTYARGVGGRLSLLRVWRKEQHTSGHPTFAPPLDVRPAGCADARFCFLISFACRSSSGIRPVFDEGSVRLRVTVTIEFEREGGVSTTGDRLPAESTCGLSAELSQAQVSGRSSSSLHTPE